MEILKFNTGREYTANGQRIAATQLEGGQIVLLDIDRHIDVMLPAGVEFTQADIMLAYDRNWYIFPTDVGMPYGDYYDVLAQLRNAAASI
jgi:hypothetical protein